MGIGRLGVVVWLCVAFAGSVYAQVPQMVPNRPDWWRNGASLDMDFYNNRYMVSLTTPVTYTSLTQFVGAVSGTFTRPGADEAATGEPFYLGANQNFVSRASAGTYFDSSGVMQTAASNVARADYDPVTHAYKGVLAEPARTNYALYSGDPTQAWWNKVAGSISTSVPIVAPDGVSFAYKYIPSTANVVHYVGQDISSRSQLANTAYTCSFYYKPDGYDVGTTELWSLTGTSRQSIPLQNGWFRYIATGTTSSSPSAGVPRCYAIPQQYSNFPGDGVSGFYIWGFQFEVGASPTSYIPTGSAVASRAADVYTSAYSGTYFDASGTLRQAPANTPRLDHDPSTTEPRGVLIEERRTNLVSNTNLMAWTSSTLYPISTGSGAYGNTSYVVTDNDVATRGGVVVRMGAVLLASTVYTSSIYVKVDPLMNDDEPLFRIGHFYGGNGDYYTGCTFNPATGATSNYGATTCRSNRYGDYWRLQWQFTTSSSAPLVAQFEVLPRGRTPSYTGSVEVFGPQLEQGSFPTSYIPTSGTAVTRAADVFKIPTNTGWFNPAEGTFLANSGGQINSDQNNWSSRIVGSDNAGTAFISLLTQNAIQSYTGEVPLLARSCPNDFSLGLYNKSAMTWSVADQTRFIACGGNSAVSNATTGAAYAGANNIAVGSAQGYVGWYLNAPIQRIVFFPNAQPSSTLPDYTR